MSYLDVKLNRSGLQFARLTFASLEHSCESMATPGPECRECSVRTGLLTGHLQFLQHVTSIFILRIEIE
jgi:hypothetical protein